MRKSAYIVIVAVVALVAFVSGNAQAQSAKFAANWSIDPVWVEVDTTLDPMCSGSGDTIFTEEDPDTGVVINLCSLAEAEILMAKIGVAQQKDLLIGVSAQIGLTTFTEVKKVTDGSYLGEALASAKVDVTLKLRNQNTGDVQIAAPGQVTFAARLQEIKVGADFEGEIMVSLLLDTTAAHHFNYLGVDLIAGDYDVIAVFDLSALATIVGEDSIANVKVVLGQRMVTVQEVRAVKDSLDPL